MKLGHILALGALAYTTYEVIKNRDEIKENVVSTAQSVQRMNAEMDNIKENSEIISDQLQNVSQISKELSLKFRYLKKDLDAHLAEIKTATDNMKK